MLKGPSIARWLYPSGGRTYVDTDILVPACEFGRARTMLKSLGFSEVVEGLHTFEQSVKVEIEFARRPALGRGPDDGVDLHRNLPMLPTPDEILWEAFSAGTETIGVGDVQVCVLGRTALALHVVVHAVQHGFQSHTSEDLCRAITVMSVDDWRPVADLAARLADAVVPALGTAAHAPILLAGALTTLWLTIVAIVGGLLAGFVITVLALSALVALDKTARREEDIEGLLGMEVVAIIRELPSQRRLPAAVRRVKSS